VADNNHYDHQDPNAGQPFGFPPPLPELEEDTPVKEPRLAALYAWWDNAWLPGGFLYDCWEDLRKAPQLGWHGMANWVKALLAVAGLSMAILLLDGAASVVADALHRLLTAAPRVQVGTDTSTGVLAVIDQPVRSYIAQHSAGLAISGSTVYTLWQLAGLFGLIGGFAGSAGARATWFAWGAASIAMVWAAAPADGRTIATAIAVLAWTVASAFALRGLSLRPMFFTHIHNAAPEQPARPAVSDAAPDNVHPLQKR